MTQTNLPMYVGYDVREHLAALVCEETIQMCPRGYQELHEKRTARPIPLAHKPLRRDGVFDRPWRIDERGQTWDVRDGRPFSTEFSHSRFVVPYLGKLEYGSGWVGFVDCDFMFRRKVGGLLEYCDPTKAVAVVKHDTSTLSEKPKMDGMIQSRYERKLWSSLMLWNLDHPANHEFVNWTLNANHWSGADLHGLKWLEDDQIGEIPPTWNYIPGLSAPDPDPAGVHWSLGGPWMPDYAQAPFAREWFATLNEVLRPAGHDGVFLDPLYPSL